LGLAIQSRFGDKASLIFNGLLPDSGFKTTDNLDRGYGDAKHSADIKVSYDITKELPVSYYQSDKESQRGFERRYELTAGSHFLGSPFLDVTLCNPRVKSVFQRTLPFRLIRFDQVLIETRTNFFFGSMKLLRPSLNPCSI
jgi:hypothetical protein